MDSDKGFTGMEMVVENYLMGFGFIGVFVYFYVKYVVMALLVIDSEDNGFLKSILDLVKRFKVAKARIETDKEIDDEDLIL